MQMASRRLPLKTVMRRFATQTGSVFVQHFWRCAFRFDSILLLPDRLGQLWPECTATNSATPYASKSSRCRPIQPRIESRCRATSGFLLIRGGGGLLPSACPPLSATFRVYSPTFRSPQAAQNYSLSSPFPVAVVFVALEPTGLLNTAHFLRMGFLQARFLCSLGSPSPICGANKSRKKKRKKTRQYSRKRTCNEVGPCVMYSHN